MRVTWYILSVFRKRDYCNWTSLYSQAYLLNPSNITPHKQLFCFFVQITYYDLFQMTTSFQIKFEKYVKNIFSISTPMYDSYSNIQHQFLLSLEVQQLQLQSFTPALHDTSKSTCMLTRIQGRNTWHHYIRLWFLAWNQIFYRRVGFNLWLGFFLAWDYKDRPSSMMTKHGYDFSK